MSTANGSGPALRLAMVTETYPPEVNGVAKTLGDLVVGLRRRGHMVQLVRPRQPSDGRPGSERDAQEVLVPGLRMPRYDGLQFGLPATGRLVTAWRAFRPDAVYVATEGPLGGSALKAARRLRVPVLSGFHTNFHTYTRYYGARLLEGAIRTYLRRFHNRAQVTVVATDELRQLLAGEGFDNVEVMHRGVDTQLFDPARRSQALRAAWGVGDAQPVVLYVGRIAPEKNLDLAVRAFRAFQAQCGGARFVLVGSGPAREHLERENPDFVFVGVKRGEPLATHYASGDVFLFPSTTETFGNVTVEAMASGLAVVAYDYAAGRELISDGRTGLLVPFDQEGAFVGAAEGLGHHPERIRRLGAAARATVLDLDWQRVFERVETLVRGLK